MQKSKEAFHAIIKKPLPEEIIKMKEEVLINDQNSIFSKPIPLSYLLSRTVPSRLVDLEKKDFLPYPFLFTPSRKDCLDKMLPLPSYEETLIEGYAQTGKSTILAHLCLMYRSQGHAVIYVCNMKHFNFTPLDLVQSELCYWFYEELKENLVAQVLLKNLIAKKKKIRSEIQWSCIENLLNILSEDCVKKKKKILFLFDGYNKKAAHGDPQTRELAQNIYKVLLNISSYKIYASTDIDQQPEARELRWLETYSCQIMRLDETNKPLPESIIPKIAKILFEGCDENVAALIPSYINNSTTLMLMFLNYCKDKGVRLLNLDIFERAFYDFKACYLGDIEKLHREFITEINPKKDPKIKESLNEIMLYMDTNIKIKEDNFEYYFLDQRLLVYFDKKIHSINPFVKEMFKQQYWKSNEIERFVEKYSKDLTGSTFGGLYEFYMNSKIKSSDKIIEITISPEITIPLFPRYHSYIHYGKKFAETSSQFVLYRINSENELGNIYFTTFQENFPTIDSVYFDFNNEQLTFFNWKTNSSFLSEKNFREKTVKNLSMLVEGAKLNKLSNHFLYYNFLF